VERTHFAGEMLVIEVPIDAELMESVRCHCGGTCPAGFGSVWMMNDLNLILRKQPVHQSMINRRLQDPTEAMLNNSNRRQVRSRGLIIFAVP
jgi:hypothetical protein